MNDSFQDVYAKYLPYDYGYPLRMPEPMARLPPKYQDDGLQIGDVGIVNSKGQFDVLFNICKRSDNPLHDHRGVPENFQPAPQGEVNPNDNAIPSGPIHSSGMKQILGPMKQSSVDYEFDSSARAGAILILPHGATSDELLSPEQFREVATKNALNWYEFAKKCYGAQHLDRSLYLITGFYKARSWCLGSFNNHTGATEKILVRRDPNSSSVYLESALFADRRNSRGSDDGGSINQTVFITGFKIRVGRWLPDPVVLGPTELETTWSILFRLFKACLNWLPDFSGVYKQHAPISVEHSPELSQPFHPSDIINRFLLSKSPNAEVAITHDSQWMDMMKGGLTHEDLLQEDRLETFLTQCYTIPVDSESVVSLQGKVDATANSVSSIVGQHSPSSELEFSSPPTPSLDNPWIVITHIRAQNILSDLKRIPVGFYVSIQFDNCQRITQNKSMRLGDSSIEWEAEIPLPSEASEKVRLTLYASFELQPMLGSGEALYRSETCVGEFIGGTHLISFSPGESGDPSLLITLARRYSNHLAAAPSRDDSNLDSDEFSDLVHETNLGQQALLRYHNIYQREDLEDAVQHFEHAWRYCPLTHRCRAAVLVNLAKAKFISYQTDPTNANLDEIILHYREALGLRLPCHPDRPATLLLLARTLLFCYEQGCDESIADEINELISKSQDFSEDSHERRAADLVLETLERYRIVESGSLAELDELVQKLEHSVRVPPDGYFDISQRLINLSTTLWRRYEKRGALDDLNRSVDINKQALQVLPARDPDRLPCLRTLGATLWRLFELRRDLNYLRELIALDKEALQLILEGHPERPYWATNYKSHRAEILEYFGKTAFEARKYDEAIAQYSQAVAVLRSPCS